MALDTDGTLPLTSVGSAHGDSRRALGASDVWKRFGHVQALRGAAITLRYGEVVTLFGDNGAGKSTLLKILCGVIKPDKGRITLGGEPVQFRSIRDAQERGIDVVFQDLALAPDLTVAENVFLGHELLRTGWQARFGFLARRDMETRADVALRHLGIGLPALSVPIRLLSGGQRQAVAVARAVMWARTCVLLDEPTAALGARQSDIVCGIIRSAAERNHRAVLVVSHDIPRMLGVADRVVVLRHGAVVHEGEASGLTVADVVALMVGGAKDGHVGQRPTANG